TRGGTIPDPTPVRRSPRLQAPPLPEPMSGRGRSQAEPHPPIKSRPRRAGPAPSRQQVGEDEEEPPEVTGHQLRPQGVANSTPPKVLFTGVVASPDMEVALETLGGSMATSVFDCTHLVTDRVRRTVKFLCAVARGVPIVIPEWLHKVPWGQGKGTSGTGRRVFGDGNLGVKGVLGDITWGFLGTRSGFLGTWDLGDKVRVLGDNVRVLGDMRALGDMGRMLGGRDGVYGDKVPPWGHYMGVYGDKEWFLGDAG
ncbi:MDC1 protein, partial [Rostratula benghalensis]|nr:MDC1 protein [Rostratula benghalensis]